MPQRNEGNRAKHVSPSARTVQQKATNQKGEQADMRNLDRTWIDKRSSDRPELKRRLGRYGATHLVDHGDALCIGSGTSLTALGYEIIARQARSGALDLQVVTSNLQIMGMGRAAV